MNGQQGWRGLPSPVEVAVVGRWGAEVVVAAAEETVATVGGLAVGFAGARGVVEEDFVYHGIADPGSEFDLKGHGYDSGWGVDSF